MISQMWKVGHVSVSDDWCALHTTLVRSARRLRHKSIVTCTLMLDMQHRTPAEPPPPPPPPRCYLRRHQWIVDGSDTRHFSLTMFIKHKISRPDDTLHINLEIFSATHRTGLIHRIHVSMLFHNWSKSVQVLHCTMMEMDNKTALHCWHWTRL